MYTVTQRAGAVRREPFPPQTYSRAAGHARGPVLRAGRAAPSPDLASQDIPGIAGHAVKEAGDQQLLGRVAHVDSLLQGHLGHDVHIVQLVPLLDGVHP